MWNNKNPIIKKYLVALPSFAGAKGFCHQTILVSAENEDEAYSTARRLSPGKNLGDIKEQV